MAPALLYFRTVLLGPSATIKNSSGERGQPCVSPSVGLKNMEADPLINEEKVTKEK